METIKDYGYGVVPVCREDGEWRVFVLHQISKANTYWTFPKGHSEEGESDTESALRELREETGIEDVTLEQSRTFNHQYYFTHENTRIDKYVLYFVGYVENPAVVLQPEEVLEGKWCTFADARVLLTYDLAKQLLDEVAMFLADK